MTSMASLAVRTDPAAEPECPLASLHPDLDTQLEFAQQRISLLRRSGASGQRALQGLHVVLGEHEPTWTNTDGQVHLTCATCRPGGRPPGEQYPCRTAASAAATLIGVL